MVPQEGQTERDNMRKEVKVHIIAQFGCLLDVFAIIFGVHKLHKCYSSIDSKKCTNSSEEQIGRVLSQAGLSMLKFISIIRAALQSVSPWP